MPMLPEPVFKSCVNVRSAAFSIAGAAQLWCDDFARSTAECDSHRADHHARPLASAVDTADSYGLDKSRNLDRATVARERRRLDGERPAMQNHATGKIMVGDDTFGDVGMEGAIPSQQVRSLNAHRVQAQFHGRCAFRGVAELSAQVRA